MKIQTTKEIQVTLDPEEAYYLKEFLKDTDHPTESVQSLAKELFNQLEHFIST